MHIASEMAPVAKVGGLGDVVAGLGRSIQNRGHRVEVIIPKYKCMDITGIKNFKVIRHTRQVGSNYDNIIIPGKHQNMNQCRGLEKSQLLVGQLIRLERLRSIFRVKYIYCAGVGQAVLLLL